MIIAGIDPGLKGGIVALEILTSGVAGWARLPVAEHEGKRRIDGRAFAGLIRRLQDKGLRGVVIETAFAKPNENRNSTATIFINYGRLLGVLEALGVDYVFVRSQSWKRMFNVGKTTEDSIIAARQFWPKYTQSMWRGKRGGEIDGVCDAALIALYGLRVGAFQIPVFEKPFLPPGYVPHGPPG